jgi:hypothetical protein
MILFILIVPTQGTQRAAEQVGQQIRFADLLQGEW